MDILKPWLLAVDLWLSTGQPQHYFRLSGACFVCPGWMDNQNFECYVQDSDFNFKKCIHGVAPIYLQELKQEYIRSCNLQSFSQLNLVSTSGSTLSYGHHSFCKVSAELWNKLPLHIKDCQAINQSETFFRIHLFTMAFDD